MKQVYTLHRRNIHDITRCFQNNNGSRIFNQSLSHDTVKIIGNFVFLLFVCTSQKLKVNRNSFGKTFTCHRDYVVTDTKYFNGSADF